MLQHCISKKALELFQKFHYSNDLWFARRIALVKKHIGNPEDAINDLLGVLRKKREWFIQKEIAELYYEKKDFENAILFAIQAVLNSGDLEYKVDLLYLIGLILKEQGESELAYKHYSLSKLIRIKESWRVPKKLLDAMNVLQLPPYPVSEFSNLKNELRGYWKSLNPVSHENQKFQKRDYSKLNNSSSIYEKSQGKVEKILHNNAEGLDGFIRTSDNRGVYFRLNPEVEIVKNIAVGTQVEFVVLPGKDGKKERAINIKLLNG
jgi:tetratricopeptide (TPR) repeat protein